MISFGVPASARKPKRPSPSTSGCPDSIIVGTDGAAAERRRPETASTRSLPALTMGSTSPRSATDFAGALAFTVSAQGPSATFMIGAKSRSALYGSFE